MIKKIRWWVLKKKRYVVKRLTRGMMKKEHTIEILSDHYLIFDLIFDLITKQSVNSSRLDLILILRYSVRVRTQL